MRILPSLLLGLSTAQDESDFKVIEQTWDDVNKVDIWHDVEESEANLGDDVFYTPCQAQRYNAKGFNITNDLILPGSGYDPSCEGLDEPAIPGALVQNVPRWTNNFTGGKYEVAYFFTSGFDNHRKDTIRSKFTEFERDTCVKLVEVDNKNDPKYSNKLEIQQNMGCSSYVGRHFKHQMLSLANRCEGSYIPLHEAMHALGWLHEQQRPDRDQYVKVWRDRCSMSDSSFNGNQGIMSDSKWIDQGTPYDVGSIMHYGTRSCAKGGDDVITKPDGSKLTLTKGHSLSQHDINQINMVYKCDMGPGTTTQAPSTTTGPNTTKPPSTTKPPNSQCCSRYSIKRTGPSINVMDNGIYEYEGQYNDKPYWKNTEEWRGRYQLLFFKANCQGPHWGTYHELNQSRMNTRTKGTNNPACPEDGLDWSLPTEIKCLDDPGTTKPPTTKPPTTKPPTTKPPTTKPPTTKPPTTKPPTTKPPVQGCELRAKSGNSCEEIGDQCQMKGTEASDGNSEGSKIKVTCRQHHRLNLDYAKDPFIYSQKSTFAYCTCEAGKCGWKFNKGDIQCSFCPAVQLQARNGKKQKFIEWDSGIAIYFPITVDARAEGMDWHAMLDFNAELKGHGPDAVEIVQTDPEGAVERRRRRDAIEVHSGNMKLTDVSKNGRIWTFTPNHDSLDVKKLTGNKKVFLIAYFENIFMSDIQKAKKAALLFSRYKMPNDSASCLVDRFDDYPLENLVGEPY